VIYFLYDELFSKHETGEFHPENPKRLTAIYNKLKSSGIFKNVIKLKSERIKYESLKRVHDPLYIEKVEVECMREYPLLSTGDTNICSSSNDVALHAAGGVLKTLDMILNSEINRGFCSVRPPGHHASADIGMGFCIYNNIALAAEHAKSNYNIEKIMVIDFDVHHGNGTQDIFYEDNSVFFISTHQHPLYPGTGSSSEKGKGRGKGFTINVPMKKGTGNDDVISVFNEIIMPAAKKFRPELTLISAGFDSRKDDPLGGFLIDDDGFRELTKMIIELSEYSGSGKILSILEGGYNHDGLSSAVLSHMEELISGS